MIEEVVSKRSEHKLPYGRTLMLENVAHESGLQMLRLTIREGRRFTIVNLDKESAARLGNDLTSWAE